jgi:RNA-directed DNA polymerase
VRRGKARFPSGRQSHPAAFVEMVQTINRKLLGWANYFSLGPTGKAYRAIDQYTPRRLRRWLCEKHKVRNSGATPFPYEYLYGTLRLVELTTLRA